MKKLIHPPEEYTFTPKIKQYNPETDKKKKKRTQKLIKETTPYNKKEIRSFISSHRSSKEKS